jgi:putative endonuclease
VHIWDGDYVTSLVCPSAKNLGEGRALGLILAGGYKGSPVPHWLVTIVLAGLVYSVPYSSRLSSIRRGERGRAVQWASMSGRITRWLLQPLDAAARILPWRRTAAEHLRVGRRGEEDVYFWLRRQGYVMVARNWRTPHRRSELDLIGWDGDVLCFIEVKTRTTRDVKPAEAAVDREKRHDLRSVARQYLRRLQTNPPARFDIASVYYEAGRAPEMTLFKNAFPLNES